MKRLAASLLLASIPAMAPAQAVSGAVPVDSSRLTAARALLDRMQFDRTLDGMFVQLAPGFATSVIGGMLTSETGKPVVGQLIADGTGGQARLQQILADEFLTSIRRQYPALKDKAAQEYAAALTIDELTAIDRFYASGPGAKFLLVSPGLQQKLASAGQSLGRVAGEEAGRRGIERAIREMLPAAPKAVEKKA